MNQLAIYLAELIHSQLEKRTPTPIPNSLDLEEIFKLSHQNHMNYLIIGGLLKASNLPEQYKAPFSTCVLRSIQSTVMQVNELKDLNKICEEKQIFNQPMKGSCMKFIYPSPEMREMSDIDILINQDRMDEIGDILIQKGYTLQQSVRQHDIYVKPPYMVIEAHRTLYDKTVDKRQFDYFSSFSKTKLREGSTCTFEFTLEDFYIYMIAHMAKHFYSRGCGIRNLVDIYIYLQKYETQMNWEYTNKELQSCSLLDFTRHMQKLAKIWLGSEKGDIFYDHLFDYMLNCGIYGKDENGIWNRFSHSKYQHKKVSPAQLKRWYFFPPLTYMTEFYPWLEDHTYLLPFAWGIRACRGIFMNKGIHKREMLETVKDDEISIYKEIYSKMGLNFKK